MPEPEPFTVEDCKKARKLLEALGVKPMDNSEFLVWTTEPAENRIKPEDLS